MNRIKTSYLVDLVLITLFFIVAGMGLFMYFLIPSGFHEGDTSYIWD